MAQAEKVSLARTMPYTPPATATDVSIKQPVSMHRALAAAQSGFKGNPDSANPHEAAVGKLQPAVIQQAKPAANAVPSATPVKLGTGQ